MASNEALFFNENAFRLSSVEQWSRFLKPEDSFMTIRANILIRSLLNKSAIERLYFGKEKEAKEHPEVEQMSLEDYMRSGLSNFPYLLTGGNKVYVAFFPLSTNALYSRKWEKLSLPPYKRLLSEYSAAVIDPFDYYGYALYDSYFTRLVPIRRTPKVLACYDYDAEALYFIDDQGRLDAKLCLFDKGIENPVKTHMVKRIEAVADAYLERDKNALLRSLVEGNLISSALVHQIAGKEIRFEKALEKKKDE